MNPLIVAIGYHKGDLQRTKNLLEWITELGGCRPHTCLLIADEEVTKEARAELAKIAKQAFDVVATIPAGVNCAWKPNQMFLSAAKWISECCKLNFLWLEPDCVPLRPDWLDIIAEEYDACPKKFMGPIIRQEGQPGVPAVHLTGCSVYPNDAWDVYDGMAELKTQIAAWDMVAADRVIPRSMNTNLIHHFWGEKDLPPIFVDVKTAESPKNFVTIDFVRKDAVLFHRSKGGELIAMLRKRAKEATSPSSVPPGSQRSSQTVPKTPAGANAT